MTPEPCPGEVWVHHDWNPRLRVRVRILELVVNTLGGREVVVENLEDSEDGYTRAGTQYSVTLDDFSRLLTWHGAVRPGYPLYVRESPPPEET
jgi:hypothetical protein